MGIFTIASIVFLATGSLSVQLSKLENLKDDLKNENCLFGGTKWIVLVAGSEGWDNYSHQADICHAYQIIRGNGIPEENIITMMADDIAYNPKNPTPGIIINQPDGGDIYGGIIIDYKREELTATNFLNVITGNKTAMQFIGTGKVVEGNHHDKVFIYYSGIGETGSIYFRDEIVYAEQLNSAFNTMHANKNYKQLLFYLESGYSGSLFDGVLSENKNILTITASGPRENSEKCYCNTNSKPYDTCLGDTFSIAWLNNLEETAFESSTKDNSIFHYYNVIRNKVTNSNIMMYGDFKIGYEKLSSFIGYWKQDFEQSAIPKIKTQKRKVSKRSIPNGASTPDVAKNDWTSLRKSISQKELRQNNEKYTMMDNVFKDIYTEMVNIRPDIENKIGEYDQPKYIRLTLDIFPCYRNIINEISRICFHLPQNLMILDRLKIFANMCSVDKQIYQTVKNLVPQVCSKLEKKTFY